MLKFFDHYRGTTISVLLWVLLAGLLVGCPASTISPVSGERVGRTQLTTEAQSVADSLRLEWETLRLKSERLAEEYELAFAEIEQKERAIAEVTAVVTQLAAQLDPTGGVMTAVGLSALGLLGFGGVTYDNRRKDKVIAQMKEKLPAGSLEQ